jgi:hypothetical protein
MKFWILPFALSAVLTGFASPAPDEPSFKADKSEIPTGGSARLMWQWNPATRGYLSSIGLVDHPSGDTISVSPGETTSYVLILEAPGVSPRILAQRVVVRGAKGSSGDWPTDPFAPLAYQADDDIHSTSMSTVAARVRSVLRDRGFEIRQFSQAEDQVVFCTAFLQDSKLNEPNESPRKFRRIAYRVALTAEKSDLIRVNLSSSIEWRIVVDARWFLENSSSSNRYKTQTDDLWSSLKAN